MRLPVNNVVALTDRWRVHLSRGVRALEAGNHDEAQAQFTEAYRRAPERAETCAALGREHMRRGQLDLAEPLLERARTLDPTLLSAAAALARLVGLGRGRLDEAHALLDQVTAQRGDEPTLLMVRGELYLESDHIDQARLAFEGALALGGDAE